MPEVSEGQLIEYLSTIIRNDGSIRKAARELGVKEGELKAIRQDHAGMYQALAAEVAQLTEDAIAQEHRELSRLSQQASRMFLEGIIEEMEENGNKPSYETRKHLPQIIQAVTKQQQVSADKLLSLTGRPQDGKGSDPADAIRELVKIGLLKPIDRPVIEGTVEEG